jgi:hypothetical protein
MRAKGLGDRPGALEGCPTSRFAVPANLLPFPAPEVGRVIIADAKAIDMRSVFTARLLTLIAAQIYSAGPVRGADFGLRGSSPPLSAEANAKNAASRNCPGSLGRHHGFLPAFGAPAAQYFSGSQHPWAAQSPAAIETLQPGRGNDATRKGSSFYNELRAAVTVIGGATLASVILPKCFAASMHRYYM